MIHGIYIRSKPKNKWHLFSLAISAEAANRELAEAQKEATKSGNAEGQAAVQTFDSVFFIPELLSEIKEQPVLFN